MNVKEAGRADRARARLCKIAFESLYGPFAWAYDWVSRTFFIGQWRLWQRAAIRFLKGGRVLEVGMGTGNLQMDLISRGYDTWGVDLSPQMVRRAARKARRHNLCVRVCRARAQSLPFPDASFDSVLSTFPSEYISDPRTLNELARVLRPGGRLVVVPGGWLHATDTRSKAFEGVARVVYGYRAEQADLPIEKIGRQAQHRAGIARWINALKQSAESAGFSLSAQIASNRQGACLILLADKPEQTGSAATPR